MKKDISDKNNSCNSKNSNNGSSDNNNSRSSQNSNNGSSDNNSCNSSKSSDSSKKSSGSTPARPSVAVVMCTYNGEKFLREQLDSILDQTYPIRADASKCVRLQKF